MNRKSANVVLCCLSVVLFIAVIVQATSTAGVLWHDLVGGLIAVLVVVVVWVTQPDRTPAETQIDEQRDALEVDQKEHGQQQRELEELKKVLAAQLEERAKQLDAREISLDDRLVAFQEWLEYPQPKTSDDGHHGPIESKLTEKDQQVFELLEKESQQLYDRIKSGRYKASDEDDGKFNVDQARNDALEFMLAVARIYQPDAQDPLLETSVSDVLRAASRTCLHLLIVLERLPLSLHDKSISTIYSYVRKAVKAYDLYQAASPYLGFASRAFNVGRFAAGVNPLTVGLTWALSEFGKKGAKTLTTKFVDQQAVGVLHDLVRVVGFEVAGIYSGEFRHRDPHWVFGSELTHLMSQFPVSRESLSRALREIGGLELRNEYDRVYLYRCLSTHRSAEPLQNAAGILSTQDCQNVVKRLENFYRSFMHGRTERRTEAWKSGVEERLGVKLVLPQRKQSGRTEIENEDLFEALESLVGFLIGVKGLKPVAAVEGLTKCETAVVAGSTQMQSIVRQITEQPPHLFEPPDIDVESELLAGYLKDLARLSVSVQPWDVQVDDVVLETCAYFGQELATARKMLDSVYVDFVGSMLIESAPTKKLEAGPLRAALAIIEDGESIQFVYHAGKLAPRIGSLEVATLIGTSKRLLIAANPEDGGVLLECAVQAAEVSKVDGMLIDDLKVSSSGWQVPFTESTCSGAIVLNKPMISRFDNWFRPLLSDSFKG